MIANDDGNKQYVYKNTIIVQYAGRNLGMLYGETYSFDDKALDIIKAQLGDHTATLVFLSA